MDADFVKAESTNLPRIDSLMVGELIALNPDFRKTTRHLLAVTSAGSGSSGASQSPIDQIRVASRGGSAAHAQPTAAARLSSGGRGDSALSRGHTQAEETSQDSTYFLNRSINRSEGRKKQTDEFDDELPLPPE